MEREDFVGCADRDAEGTPGPQRVVLLFVFRGGVRKRQWDGRRDMRRCARLLRDQPPIEELYISTKSSSFYQLVFVSLR